jgi:hypothetical protein
VLRLVCLTCFSLRGGSGREKAILRATFYFD